MLIFLCNFHREHKLLKLKIKKKLIAEKNVKKKCNRQRRWLDIAITKMNAGRLVRCNCERYGKLSDAFVTDMADGRVRM